MISKGLALSLSANGAGVDLSDPPLVGLRLLRRLNHPAMLSLRFSLSGPDQPAPLPDSADVILSDGDAALFNGRAATAKRSIGPDGTYADITLVDRLDRLAQSWTASTSEISSIQRFLADAARRCDLQVSSAGVKDFAIGRHLNLAISDLDHVTGIAARYGLGLSCRIDELLVTDLTRQAEQADHMLDIADIVSASVTASAGDQRTAPSWQGWTADDDRTLHGNDRIGRSAPGRRGRAVRVGEPHDRLAATDLARKTAGHDILSATLTGLANFWPGQTASAPFVGTVASVMTEVEILMDSAGGARTRLTTQPSHHPDPATAGSFITGFVADTSDPIAAGRLRITLHGHSAATTGWLPVVGHHSRQDGGTGLAVPLAKGDPVVVAAPDGDPELGMVLGGLARSGAPGTSRSGPTRHRQTWQGSGMQIEMDEQDGAIRLSLGTGAQIDVNGKNITAHAPGDLTLSSNGRVTISGNRIDFEQA